MKYCILTVLILSFGTAFGQNQLTDLYTIQPGNHYPNDMPHVQQWINKTLAPIFVRNLQNSNSSNSSSSFLSFNIAGRATTGFELLNTNGVRFIPATGNIRLQYNQDILNYLQFDVNKFDYTLKSYFILASRILRITPPQMVANTFNFFVSGNGEDKYNAFIDDVNKRMQTHLPYAANKKIDNLTAILQQAFPDKISEVIFQTYISGKSDTVTRINMQRFYNITGFFTNDGVVGKINEMINIKLQFRQGQPEQIQIPNTMLALTGALKDSLVTFNSDYAKAILDYKDKQLKLSFYGHLNHKAIVKNGFIKKYDTKTGMPFFEKPQKPLTDSQDFNELDMLISENGVSIIVITPQLSNYQLLNNTW